MGGLKILSFWKNWKYYYLRGLEILSFGMAENIKLWEDLKYYYALRGLEISTFGNTENIELREDLE